MMILLSCWMYPTMLLPPLVTRLAVAPYEAVQVASLTSVMHLSTFLTMAGRVEAAE